MLAARVVGAPSPVCAWHRAGAQEYAARFLGDLGICEQDALLPFRLALSRTRRYIDMMGVAHRPALGGGPAQLRKLAPRVKAVTDRRSARVAEQRHNRQREILIDRSQLSVINRSALGLARIYNMLPRSIVKANDVSTLHSKLQAVVKVRAARGRAGWMDIPSRGCNWKRIQHGMFEKLWHAGVMVEWYVEMRFAS